MSTSTPERVPHVNTSRASVTVRPVHSAKERQAFIDFQYDLYQGHRYWVPPLRMEAKKTLDEKNPFFEHGRMQLFLAYDATGTVVGRIAGIVNGMHLQKYDDATGFFGFFECAGDYAVAEALLGAAAAWLRQQGMTRMRGPVSPTQNDGYAALLVDGFDREPSLLMAYNPPYYEGFLLRYGFERATTMWAYYLHKKYVNTDRLRRGAEIVYRRHPELRLRTLRPARFDEEVDAAARIYNAAWAENWGHVPYTQREAEHLARDLKQIIEPELFFFLEMEGRPVAFSVTLPNMNQALRHVKDGRLLPFGLLKILARAKLGGIYETRMPLMGVLPEYHGRGFYAPLVLKTVEEGPKLGYDACEMSWVLDSNTVLKNALTQMGGVVDKEYALFEKPLGE